MDMQEIVKLNIKNINTALEDYARYTYATDVLDNVSQDFVIQLAKDSAYAKQSLRELFSKSPVWNEELQAIVINGTRTKDPDLEKIERLMYDIMAPAIDHTLTPELLERNRLIYKAMRFFYEDFEPSRQDSIAAINALAPYAYHEGRKPSKILKALCQALGIADETTGSKFQKLYAQVADEMSSKKIDFKLYMSINPAHFITMSNPKEDSRGETLTSCHSFNRTDYSYNNGCSGYARDEVTFIVFTAADPNDPETLNNRKTTRQIFAYEPGNGVLLQSRLYNTSGGTSGAQEESKLYRDLVQREISDLENAINLWDTAKYCEGDEEAVVTGEGFGGYEDWVHPSFNAKISIRKDCKENWHPLTVGTYGLCIKCGEETSNGLYCEECENENKYLCDCCEEYEDTTNEVYDANGRLIYVCDECLDNCFTYCDVCGSYHHNSVMTEVDYSWVCDECFENRCAYCGECNEVYFIDDMTCVTNEYGEEVWVCSDCRDEKYTMCQDCGEYFYIDTLYTVHDEHGQLIQVCKHCRDYNFEECEDCGEWWPEDKMVNCRCPECQKEEEGVA